MHYNFIEKQKHEALFQIKHEMKLQYFISMEKEMQLGLAQTFIFLKSWTLVSILKSSLMPNRMGGISQ